MRYPCDESDISYLLEVAKNIKDMRKDRSPLTDALYKFIGSNELPDIKFSDPIIGAKYSPEEEKKYYEYSAAELFEEINELAKDYNSHNPKKQINVSGIYHNGTLVGYTIDNLKKEKVFCSFLGQYVRKGLTKEHLDVIHFDHEVLDKGSFQGITEEDYKNSPDYYGGLCRKLPSLLAGAAKMDDLFGNEEFDEDALGKSLGITLNDIDITPGPGSKKRAFLEWLAGLSQAAIHKEQEL